LVGQTASGDGEPGVVHVLLFLQWLSHAGNAGSGYRL